MNIEFPLSELALLLWFSPTIKASLLPFFFGISVECYHLDEGQMVDSFLVGWFFFFCLSAKT